MGTKLPVWLSTVDILRKYEGLCLEKNFSRKFIIKLFRANLLRGYYDSHNKKFMILEESWLDLVKHVLYNLYLQVHQISGEQINFSIPPYCHKTLTIRYNLDKNWYTATELLDEYNQLETDRIFDVAFIRQLVHCGLVRGGYDPKEKITQILKASFIELLLYRDYILQQNMISPKVA